MKQLSSKQLEFLKNEFGIDSVDYNDKEALNSIRMKCFDYEVSSCISEIERGNDTDSLGEKGDIAVSIVDELFEIINQKAI